MSAHAILAYGIIALLIVNALAVIVRVGKPRAAVTPGEAASVVAVNGVLIALLAVFR